MKPICLVATAVEDMPDFLPSLSEQYQVLYIPDYSGEYHPQAKQVEAIFTNPNNSRVFWNSEVLNEMPSLKVLCTASTGTVHVDKIALANNGVRLISITTEYETLQKITSTAELALMLLLACARKFVPAADSVRSGNWDYSNFIGRQINCLTIGVLGYGRLGRIFCRLLKGFESRILVYDVSDQARALAEAEGFEVVGSVFELFSESDAVSLHIHADRSNYNLINDSVLNSVGQGFILVNTSRGEIVDEEAVLRLIHSDPSFQYGTDVLANETKWSQNPILARSIENSQITVTPHMGGMTFDARNLAYKKALNLLLQFRNE